MSGASQHASPDPITSALSQVLSPLSAHGRGSSSAVPRPSQGASPALRGCWGQRAGGRTGQTLQVLSPLGRLEVDTAPPAPLGWDLPPRWPRPFSCGPGLPPPSPGRCSAPTALPQALLPALCPQPGNATQLLPRPSPTPSQAAAEAPLQCPSSPSSV